MDVYGVHCQLKPQNAEKVARKSDLKVHPTPVILSTDRATEERGRSL